jgi:phage-related protein
MVAVVYILGNAFAAVMPMIADIVSGLLTSLTAVFTGIQEIWAGTVAFFTALINGDWAGAWEAAKGIGRSFLRMFAGIFRGLWAVGRAFLTALVTFITGILTDMGVDVEGILATLKLKWNLAWFWIKYYTKTAINAVIELWETVKTWFTETLPANLESLRADFADKWEKIKNSTVDFLNLILDPIKAIGEWLETKLSTAAGTLKTFLQTFTIPNPFELIQNGLSAIENMILGFPAWLQNLKDNMPSIPNPFAGWSIPEAATNFLNLIPGMATGSQFAPGGLTLVGERGPELVNLPMGARVYRNGSPETNEALNGGGGNVTNVYNLTANYGYQSPGSLADDVTLLQMMAGA